MSIHLYITINWLNANSFVFLFTNLCVVRLTRERLGCCQGAERNYFEIVYLNGINFAFKTTHNLFVRREKNKMQREFFRDL